MKEQTWQKRFSRILFVDDEPDLLAAASSLLRASGYEVASAQTAADAETHLSKGQFDVLMTDLTMPDCSGWDLALRSKELWPHKPVVLVTGWGLQLDTKQMNAGKVDGVLSKPFTLQELHQTLDSLP